MALRAAREASGKTQAEVAAEAGITERGYQLIESKSGYRAVRTAIRIAKALNRDTGDMEALFGQQQSQPDGNQTMAQTATV
jgi:transcriptional regulator with XRE-family HTH domain